MAGVRRFFYKTFERLRSGSSPVHEVNANVVENLLPELQDHRAGAIGLRKHPLHEGRSGRGNHADADTRRSEAHATGAHTLAGGEGYEAGVSSRPVRSQDDLSSVGDLLKTLEDVMQELVTTRDNAEIVRTMLHRENEYINHRIVWMAAFEGLLLASLGFAWGKNDTEALTLIFCLLGIAVSALTIPPLVCSSLAVRDLLLWWDRNKNDYDGPAIIGWAPRNPRSFLMLTPAWIFVPLCFIVGWLGIFVISLRKGA